MKCFTSLRRFCWLQVNLSQAAAYPVLARCYTEVTGRRRWHIRFDPAKFAPDITVVIRLKLLQDCIPVQVGLGNQIACRTQAFTRRGIQGQVEHWRGVECRRLQSTAGHSVCRNQKARSIQDCAYRWNQH